MVTFDLPENAWIDPTATISSESDLSGLQEIKEGQFVINFAKHNALPKLGMSTCDNNKKLRFPHMQCKE